MLKELENRTLQNILSEMNKPAGRVSSKKSQKGKQQMGDEVNTDNWPPKKFANVRSSGYGTSWSPKPIRRSPSTQVNNGKTQSIPNRLNNLRRSNDNKANRSSRSKNKHDFLNQSDNTNTLQSTGRNDELIANLQSKLISFISVDKFLFQVFFVFYFVSLRSTGQTDYPTRRQSERNEVRLWKTARWPEK